jgi:hypothetical protein
MKDPEFDKAYRAPRRAAFGQSIAKLHQMSGAAVSTLGKVMVDPTTPPSRKVKATEAIITHCTPGRRSNSKAEARITLSYCSPAAPSRATELVPVLGIDILNFVMAERVNGPRPPPPSLFASRLT